MRHIFHTFDVTKQSQYKMQPAPIKDRAIAQLIDGIILGFICSIIFYAFSGGEIKSIWVSPMFPQYLLEVAPEHIMREADFWWGGKYASWILSYGKEINIAYPAPLIWIIYAFYYVYFTAQFGQTPGKMMKKMTVLDLNGNHVENKKAFTRWVFYLVSLLPLGIGFFNGMKDEKQRTWHDLLAKTIVYSFEER